MSNDISTSISLNAFGSESLVQFPEQTAQDALESPESLQEIVQAQAREIEALKTKLEAMQKDMDSLASNDLNQLRLINDLRKGQEPQPLQRDRGEILRALIVANGGKMLATDARKKMHLSRQTFSELLSKVEDDIETKPYHLNKSWKVLVLR